MSKRDKMILIALVLAIVSSFFSGIRINTLDIENTLYAITGGFPFVWLELFYSSSNMSNPSLGIFNAFMFSNFVGYRADLLIFIVNAAIYYVVIKFVMKIIKSLRK